MYIIQQDRDLGILSSEGIRIDLPLFMWKLTYLNDIFCRCPVCLSDYRKEDILRILPHCGHYFHVNCIDLWLLQNSTCPVCRISLRETNEKKRAMPPLFSSRSSYTQSVNIHTYQCLLTARGLPSSSQENPGTNLIQGNQSVSRDSPEEVRVTINPIEGNCTLKDSANDHIENLSCV